MTLYALGIRLVLAVIAAFFAVIILATLVMIFVPQVAASLAKS